MVTIWLRLYREWVKGLHKPLRAYYNRDSFIVSKGAQFCVPSPVMNELFNFCGKTGNVFRVFQKKFCENALFFAKRY